MEYGVGRPKNGMKWMHRSFHRGMFRFIAGLKLFALWDQVQLTRMMFAGIFCVTGVVEFGRHCAENAWGQY